MSRTAALTAFSPAQEVSEPRLFAGRQEQIRQLSDALRTPGSCPVIYGSRGLGKSSLAVQCQLIAMGNGELLEEIHAADWKLKDEETFLTFFITCSDDVDDLTKLQQRILNSFRSYADQVTRAKDVARLVDRETRRRFTFKIFEMEQVMKYEEEAKKIREEDLSLIEKIAKEADLLAEYHDQKVLVIIDELDRVKNTAGLASFLKALSTDRLKFVLVGIAQSISELDLDHASIERHLWPIHVPLMTKSELHEVVDRAMQKLASDDVAVTFDTTARSSLVRAAAGFPWFIHVIGQAALLKAMESGSGSVTEESVHEAIAELAENRFAQLFRDMYQRAVRDSAQREIVLRSFAHWPGSDIPTSAVYAWCKKLGVTNPTVYKGHLCSANYGAPLMVPGFQERGLVRFRNEMFKHYIRLARSLFIDIDENVRNVVNE